MEHLWIFLDIDPSTVSILRFLGPLQNEAATLQAVEDLKTLFCDDANLGRASQDLVIERLIKCTSLEHPLLLTRACLTLTQICLKCPSMYGVFKNRSSVEITNFLFSTHSRLFC